MKDLLKYISLAFFIFFSGYLDCYSDDGLLHLQKGLRAYQESADFDQAISELEQALKSGLVNSEDQLKAHLYLGFAYIGKELRLHAEIEFGKAIRINPSLKLDSKVYSSKILSVFEYVRARLVDSITVISSPGQAEVYLDDQKVGITPLKLNDVLTGEHVLKVTKKLYQPKVIEIQVNKGDDNQFKVELDKQDIEFILDSQPTGARVYILDKDVFDSNPYGLTPVTLKLALDQEMAVKLSKEEFSDKELKLKLTDAGFKLSITDELIQIVDNTSSIKINLESAPPPGILKVTTNPAKATVYLDGIVAGESPLTIEKVTPGTRNIRISIPGFPSEIRKVEITSGKVTSIYTELGGGLYITSLPDGARVFINEKYMGITPFKTERMPAGSYQIRLTKESCRDKSSTVLVEKGKEKEVKFRLPQLKGSLSVSSDPPGAGVILDGEFKGNTPIIIYGIPIGQHSLKLLKSGHEDWQKQINIQDLKLTWQFVKLIRI